MITFGIQGMIQFAFIGLFLCITHVSHILMMIKRAGSWAFLNYVNLL